jgi:hypothetical protein
MLSKGAVAGGLSRVEMMGSGAAGGQDAKREREGEAGGSTKAV